jgi:hypothetical protein
MVDVALGDRLIVGITAGSLLEAKMVELGP